MESRSWLPTRRFTTRWLAFWLLFSHLDHDHRAIVLRPHTSDKVRETPAHRFHDFIRRFLPVASYGFRQPLQSELFTLLVSHFHNAVGVEDQYVVCLKGQLGFLVFLFR